jgi:GNAT superfamily N-acetyltransferase
VSTRTLELRIARPGTVDLAETVDVLNAAFRRHSFLARDRTSLEEISTELVPESRLVQVLDDGVLVGTATVTPALAAHVDSHKFPGIDLSRSLYFGMAGVRPDRMGDGVGQRLLAAAEQIAREEGFDRVILGTVEEMGNVAYYGRFGYRSVSIRELPTGYWGLTIPTHDHGMVKDVSRRAIREARPEYAPAIAALVNLAYRVEDFFKIGDRTDADEIRSIIERDRFLVVEDADRLVACAYLAIEGERGHFGMLSVHPEAQGGGLARTLIEHMEQTCAAGGCRYLDLEYVNLREELPTMYRRLGFEVTGEEPWPAEHLHRISRPAHFITMSKALTPSPQETHG